MALRISRRSTDCGRPPGLGLGIRGWTSFHWASVRSVGYFASHTLFYAQSKGRGSLFTQALRVGANLLGRNLHGNQIAWKYRACA